MFILIHECKSMLLNNQSAILERWSLTWKWQELGYITSFYRRLIRVQKRLLNQNYRMYPSCGHQKHASQSLFLLKSKVNIQLIVRAHQIVPKGMLRSTIDRFKENFDKILGCPRTIRKVEPNNVSNPWAHSMPCDYSWDQHHRRHISTGWFSKGYKSA